jgi:molybdopterin-guanine dinucleotide biosynthesis protein A
MTGVILAGGKSKRMGQNKALMDHRGKPLIQHVLETIRPLTERQMIIGDPALYEGFGVPVHADAFTGKGPLAGLHSALKHSTTDLNFIVGCDMPNIDRSILDHLSGHLDESHDAFVPIHDGLIEPLCAIYHKRCLSSFAECVETDVLKLSEAFVTVRVKFVPVGAGTNLEDLYVFKNLNTPQDTKQ